jgi:hypothetical protein
MISMSGAQTAAIKGLAEKMDRQEETIEALTARLAEVTRGGKFDFGGTYERLHYRFTGPDGKEVTIVGKAAMKAYMVANLDFFRSALGCWGKPNSGPRCRSRLAPGLSRLEPSTRRAWRRRWRAGAHLQPDRRDTGAHPSVLADEFGEDGIARLERAGFLRIVPLGCRTGRRAHRWRRGGL